jgi:hypothetical protein
MFFLKTFIACYYFIFATIVQTTLGYNTNTYSNANQPENYCKQFSPKCTCENTYTLTCNNFRELDELNFILGSALLFKYALIQPIEPIRLDQSFNILYLIFDNNAEITLKGFHSYDILVNPFTKINRNQVVLNFNDTSMEFFYQNKLIDEKICNSLILEETPLLASSNRINLFESVRFPTKLCPKVFYQAEKTDLNLYKQQINNNQMTFMKNVQQDEQMYAYKINSINMFNSQVSLDLNFIDANVFKSITSLNLYNTYLFDTRNDFFHYFRYLKSISLDLTNLKESLVKMDKNNFLTYLNYYLPVQTELEHIPTANLNEQTEILFSDSNKLYEFGDEDLCLFRKFPHEKLVYPTVSSKEKLECSCTVIWLLRYSKFYRNRLRLETQSIRHCLQNEFLFNETLKKCNIDERIQTCKKEDPYASSRQGLSGWELALIVVLPFLFFLTIILLILYIWYSKQTKMEKNVEILHRI